MLTIGIIVGSTRPNRKAAEVAHWVHGIAKRRTDADFVVLDLADQDLPLLDEPLPPSLGDYRNDHTRAWAAKIAPLDGFVFVTPEYNHAPPAALKNAVDFLSAEWRDKAAGLVGYGSAGGIRAVEQLRLVLAELHVATVRDQVALSLFHDFADMTDLTPAGFQEAAVETMLDRVVAWSGALGTLRAA